jgi:chemotaxis protein methyltransferase CheR
MKQSAIRNPIPNTQYPISNTDYELFRELILARTGMLFGPRRRDALASGVLAAAERVDCESLGKYCRLLQGARTDSELWDDLIGAITVGETYFFRNPAHFDALRQHILPDLIARHRGDRRLRIWSAGCSTGEEPYSIAILLRQLLPDIADWNILILATDINKQALRQARQGRYREWSFRQTAPFIRDLYFIPQDDLFELIPQVREMVAFAYLNLAEGAYPSLATNTNAMDLILCRNVAIYLPEAVTQEIAGRFHRCLVTDGWLIVGASETDSMVYDQFATRNCAGATAYQKTRRLRDTETPSRRGDTETRRHGEVTPSPRLPITPSPYLPITPSPPPVQPAAPLDPYQEGLALLEQGRLEEAMARFQTCLERDPDSAPARYQMARAHANRGQLEEAQSWCQRAIERDPLLTEARYTLALIHQEEGAPDQAIAQLKKTLYLDPSFALAHFSLANLYQQVGRQAEAARHRAQAIRLAAKMPPDDVVPGSDDLTAGRLLTMVRATI